MSYNIDQVIIIKEINAKMRASDILKLCAHENSDNLSESCFLTDLEDVAYQACNAVRVCSNCSIINDCDANFCKKCATPIVVDLNNVQLINLRNLEWCGSGSGGTYDYFVEHVAPLIIGELHVIFVWEGGDSMNGLAIKDGRVQECAVIQTLKLPSDWRDAKKDVKKAKK